MIFNEFNDYIGKVIASEDNKLMVIDSITNDSYTTKVIDKVSLKEYESLSKKLISILEGGENGKF